MLMLYSGMSLNVIRVGRSLLCASGHLQLHTPLHHTRNNKLHTLTYQHKHKLHSNKQSYLPYYALAILASSLFYHQYDSIQLENAVASPSPATLSIDEHLMKILSPFEQTRMRELIARVSIERVDDSDYLVEWIGRDPTLLLRYLRANQHDVNKAWNSMCQTARWRINNQIDSVSADELRDLLCKENMYVLPGSVCGRSVLYNRKSADISTGWNQHTYTQELRLFVYTMERAAAEMDQRAMLTSSEGSPINDDVDDAPFPLHSVPSVGSSSSDLTSAAASLAHLRYPALATERKWVFVVDLANFNKSSATPWHITKSFIDVLRYHYPERLHRAVILDCPKMLRVLLNLIIPFLDQKTVAKVVFVQDRASTAARQQLIEACEGDLSLLPTALNVPGCQASFDLDQYISSDPLTRKTAASQQEESSDVINSIKQTWANLWK